MYFLLKENYMRVNFHLLHSVHTAHILTVTVTVSSHQSVRVKSKVNFQRKERHWDKFLVRHQHADKTTVNRHNKLILLTSERNHFVVTTPEEIHVSIRQGIYNTYRKNILIV